LIPSLTIGINMNRIRSLVISLAGWGFIATVLYICAALTLYVLVSLSPWPFRHFPLTYYQNFHYFTGGRNIWQYDPACAQTDVDLVYKPRDGACHFTNLEFDTTLNFDALGRNVPARAKADMSLPGIAVLGDSYAMGWGVEDEETFANVMQTSIRRPVYNLAVSSYGTERELKRLALSGLADKVDTVFILYCDNDLGENRTLLTPADYATAARGFNDSIAIGEGMASFGSRTEFLNTLLMEVVMAPVEDMVRRLINRPEYSPPGGPTFADHIGPLRQTLLRYQDLLAGKQVYVGYVRVAGTRFADFPAGRDPLLPNVTWLEPPMVQQDFFVIDDHLAAVGHRHLGEWLVAALGTQQSKP